jgi:group I intron endonuclease
MPNINKDKKYHFIYKTTNLINSKFYIGMHSTSNLNDGYIGSGKRLKRSIKKYGIENFKFEILEYCDTRELLAEREKYIVNQEMINDVFCMNLQLGGVGGFSGPAHKEKFLLEGTKNGRIRTNEILKNKFGGNENWISLFNSHVSKIAWRNDEYRKNKLKNLDWTGKKHSEESKIQMSLAKKGTGIKEFNSQYGTCWITKDNINKKIKKENIEPYIKDGWIKGRK